MDRVPELHQLPWREMERFGFAATIVFATPSSVTVLPGLAFRGRVCARAIDPSRSTARAPRAAMFLPAKIAPPPISTRATVLKESRAKKRHAHLPRGSLKRHADNKKFHRYTYPRTQKLLFRCFQSRMVDDFFCLRPRRDALEQPHQPRRVANTAAALPAQRLQTRRSARFGTPPGSQSQNRRSP